MSEDCHSSENVPRIQAQCAECGFLFDLCKGTDCPACHHTGVRWARLVNEDEEVACGLIAQQRMRRRLDAWANEEEMRRAMRSFSQGIQYSNETGLPLSKDERKSIDECEAIYALKDERP